MREEACYPYNIKCFNYIKEGFPAYSVKVCSIYQKMMEWGGRENSSEYKGRGPGYLEQGTSRWIKISCASPSSPSKM